MLMPERRRGTGIHFLKLETYYEPLRIWTGRKEIIHSPFKIELLNFDLFIVKMYIRNLTKHLKMADIYL